MVEQTLTCIPPSALRLVPARPWEQYSEPIGWKLAVGSISNRVEGEYKLPAGRLWFAFVLEVEGQMEAEEAEAAEEDVALFWLKKDACVRCRLIVEELALHVGICAAINCRRTQS
eukprot:2827760-Amphidinium_carterae.1